MEPKHILYRTNDERREAEGEDDEEEDPDVVSNERGPGGETATEEAEDQELDFEETVGDPEDQSISRRRGNEILQTIILCLNLLINVLFNNKAKGQESRNVIFTSTGCLLGAILTSSCILGSFSSIIW